MPIHKRPEIWAIVLFCVTLLVYLPAKNFDFISLDDHAFVDPPQIRGGLTADDIRWAFTSQVAANWHPITTLTHIADAQLFGKAPAGPHLVNVLLHAINALLAFAVFQTLARSPWPSLIVAALFALHPLRVESVAWVAERKDVLSGTFFLLTLWCYAKFARASTAKSRVWYAATLIAFAIGLMSKPMLVTTPAVLLLLDFWPLQRTQSVARLVVEKVPFALLAIGASVITLLIQRHAGAMHANQFPLPLRIENAIYAYGRYLWKTIWPTKLAIFYPYFGALPGTSIPLAGLALSAVALPVITALTSSLWRTTRAPLIGWLWFVGMLVPVIGIVQVGMQSMADRYTYLPHLGLFAAIVFGIAELLRRFRIHRGAVVVIVVIVLGALTFRTSQQLSTWQNSITVFEHALAVTSHNHVAHDNLAVVLMHDPTRRSEAAGHLRAAIDITPNAADPYLNLGLLYEADGNHAEAAKWFEQAIQRNPNLADAHLDLGSALMGQRQVDRAIAEFQKAASLDPKSFLAHYNLALAISQKSGDAAAVNQFNQAVHLNSSHAEARYSLAMALRAAGREADAIKEFATAGRLAQEQHLDALAAEIARQQNQSSALPNATTKKENPRP